jgi:uncharacterized protein YqfA (UPF0365 family)
MSLILIIVVAAAGIALAIALAYVPMQLLINQMAKNVQEFIQRQRERRQLSRDTPDRRKVM